jgi:predicted Zn-dependent protease
MEITKILGREILDSPDSINPRFNLAIALVKATRYDDAIAEYQRILTMDPDDPQVKQRLAEAQAAKARQGH